MANKLFWALMVFCIVNVSFAARLPRDASKETENDVKVEKKTETSAEKKTASSEELTKEDVEKFRKEMKEVMPEAQANKLADIMSKFTKDATSDEMIDGVVGMLFFMAESGIKEADVKKAFEEMKDSSEEKTKDEKKDEEKKDEEKKDEEKDVKNENENKV